MSNTTTTTTVAQAEIAGRIWNIEIRNINERYGSRRWDSKRRGYVEPLTRIFVSTPDEFENIFYDILGAPHPEVEMFPHLALESVYTTLKEYPEVDKAWDRYNRAYVKAQSAVLNAVKALTKVDEFRFDKHAGCSCPCSPGFIAKSGENHRGTTIWVSLKPAS